MARTCFTQDKRKEEARNGSSLVIVRNRFCEESKGNESAGLEFCGKALKLYG